jgi:hypothetical protein
MGVGGDSRADVARRAGPTRIIAGRRRGEAGFIKAVALSAPDFLESKPEKLSHKRGETIVSSQLRHNVINELLFIPYHEGASIVCPPNYVFLALVLNIMSVCCHQDAKISEKNLRPTGKNLRLELQTVPLKTFGIEFARSAYIQYCGIAAALSM